MIHSVRRIGEIAVFASLSSSALLQFIPISEAGSLPVSYELVFKWAASCVCHCKVKS